MSSVDQVTANTHLYVMCYLRKHAVELTKEICCCGDSTYTFDSYPTWCGLPQAGQLVIHSWNYSVPRCTIEDLTILTSDEAHETAAILQQFDKYIQYTHLV